MLLARYANRRERCMSIERLLRALETEGSVNDDKAASRSEKMLNITRDTGEFFALLVKATQADTVLEIGTSNGYSTLWFAHSLPDSGHITTLEILDSKIALAHRNFERSGLGHKITQIQSDASEYFNGLEHTFDIVFLDAERVEYMNVAEHIINAIRPGGLLICDNALSHAHELEAFFHFIADTQQFTTSLVPVGKGEYLAYKNP